MMNKYVKNYILSSVNTFLTLLFPIITFPYVSRVLGPTSLGVINFVQSYGYYFIHIASFGINSYAIREVSKVRDDKAKVEKISNEIFNLNIFFSIIATMLYFSGAIFAQNLRENFVVFSIYSIVIITNFLSLDWLLQSFDDYLFSTIRNVIIRIIAIVATFLLIQSENDYIIYMIITCITEMGVKFSSLFYSRKTYARLRPDYKFLNFRGHIKPLFTIFSFRLVNGIASNLDKLMIGFMMVYASVGVYSAGVKFVLLLSPIVETIGIVLFPKINISAGASKEEYERNLKINYNLILLVAIPMAVGMFLISNRLIPLFAGEAYSDAIVVSRIMSAIILLGPIIDLLGSKTLLVHKKDRWLLISSLIVAASNIILNLIFIPLYGINGAAVASLMCYGIAIVVRLFFTKRITKFNLLNFNLLKYSLFVTPFIVLYIVFKEQIDNSNIWMFGFVGVCIIIYVLELLISKDSLFKLIIQKAFSFKKKEAQND